MAKQIDDSMPSRIQQWGREGSPDTGYAYIHWTLEYIYRIAPSFNLKTGKTTYTVTVRQRYHSKGPEPIDDYKPHNKASEAAQAAVNHFTQTLRRGSLSGSTMATKKATTKKRATTRKASGTKSRKSTKRSTLGSTAKSTSANKAAATSRVTKISRAAQKLYRAAGNRKTWPQCIKAASKAIHG